MANSTGGIKSRLWSVFLIFHIFTEKDFPNELKEYWSSIYNALTQEEPSYDANGELTSGRVQNTLKVISE